MSTTQYNLPDGRHLFAGTPFSLVVQLTPSKADTIRFSPNWLELQTPANLARYGITKEVIADPSPAPPTTAELLAAAAGKRRDLANGSAVINVGARSIPTWVDPESRGSVTGLVVALQFAPDLAAPWKGSDGVFYTLTAAEMPALALGMMQFVQECFTAEGAVATLIAAGTITTFEEIDAYAWPSTT